MLSYILAMLFMVWIVVPWNWDIQPWHNTQSHVNSESRFPVSMICWQIRGFPLSCFAKSKCSNCLFYKLAFDALGPCRALFQTRSRRCGQYVHIHCTSILYVYIWVALESFVRAGTRNSAVPMLGVALTAFFQLFLFTSATIHCTKFVNHDC